MLPVCAITLPSEDAEGNKKQRPGDEPVIDVHAHLMTPAATELIQRHYSPDTILANEPYDLYAGEASREQNRKLGPTLIPRLRGTDDRVVAMDAMGVDVQVLASFVTQNYYWTDAHLGQELARLQNDRLAEAADEHPGRFVAIGTVPMQHTASAVAELEYVVQTLGFKGVQISSNIDGVDLDDPRFRPFFQRAQELGAVVQIHPSGFTDGRRLDDWFFTNIIGNPLDSSIALTRLIFSGRLEEFSDLKLVVVHGGGYTPFYSARLDHGWRARPEARTHIKQPPSTYLKNVYFDTMVFTPLQLEHLIDVVGVERIMLGTDYPFDMGEDDPVGLIEKVRDLSEHERHLMRGGTAAELFGIT